MKTIKLFLTLFIIFSFISCDDYVDYDAKEDHQVVAEDYFASESDFEAALIGVYDVLQWTTYNVMIGDIASDNSLCGGESATDVIGLQRIDDFLTIADNDQLDRIWRYMYEGINRANYLVENINKLDSERKESLYGEVYFLRAYFYFELVKFFGDVPLFVDRRLTASDSGTLKRTSVAEVYNQIENDLNSAVLALPSAQSERGRATRSAAQSLLGKVQLYQQKYDEAASSLEQVIGVFGLVNDFGSQFLRQGENGVESIFEIQHTNTSNWYDWGFVPPGTEGNFMIIHHGIRGYSGPVYAQGWSFNVPTQDLVDAYQVGDNRKDDTILDIESFSNANGASYTTGYEHTGYFNNKYIPRAGETDAQPELNYLTNYRAIRYADVLLMAAEANALKSSPDFSKATNYLNQVRERAFGNSDNNLVFVSQDGIVKAILDERRLELAMEGHRFFDLVRTGQASSELEGFISGKHELFPIPQTEIDISGLTQNPGY